MAKNKSKKKAKKKASTGSDTTYFGLVVNKSVLSRWKNNKKISSEAFYTHLYNKNIKKFQAHEVTKEIFLKAVTEKVEYVMKPGFTELQPEVIGILKKKEQIQKLKHLAQSGTLNTKEEIFANALKKGIDKRTAEWKDLVKELGTDDIGSVIKYDKKSKSWIGTNAMGDTIRIVTRTGSHAPGKTPTGFATFTRETASGEIITLGVRK